MPNIWDRRDLQNGQEKEKVSERMGRVKSKKRADDLTFGEFLEEAKKEGTEELGRNKQWILNALRSEGFTEEQIYSMNMKRVWKFFIDHLSKFFEEGLTEISMALQQGIITPDQRKLFMKESKKMIEELEEFNEELKETLKKEKAKPKKKSKRKK